MTVRPAAILRSLRCLFARIVLGGLLLSTTVDPCDASDELLQNVLGQRCIKCHGQDEVNAEIDVREFRTRPRMLARPAVLEKLLGVLENRSMPPEGEDPLAETDRKRLIPHLRSLLKESVSNRTKPRSSLRRLNRFQYNNTVRDIFELDRDVFALPEKLMTRHENYLTSQERLAGRMPDDVKVASHSLSPLPGLRDVKPFPRDLQAAHGYDNQSNQLTLSPLLLDAFLRLSVSIVESPDFNPETVGIWNRFFALPDDDKDLPQEIRRRLSWFLRMTFRRPVDRETVDRYSSYAESRMQQGLTFSDSMKKVASAALSSPRFLYRSSSDDESRNGYRLAENLSYFLWGSCPDRELLELAESGQISESKTLRKTVDRMLADPRIERFLDSFPGQWMQLSNLLAVTPDPGINRYFSLDPKNPASLQMIIEPLLLFDAVFVENRPISELLRPDFSYRSDFLDAWYQPELRPDPVDREAITARNVRNDRLRSKLGDRIALAQRNRDALIEPIRKRILEARQIGKGRESLVDLKPVAAWEFDGDLKASVGELDLQAKGEISFRDGQVVLNRSFLQSTPLKEDLRVKTLEVWCVLENLDQPGGGLMGVQGPGDFFDTIVIGERKKRHWISGSNGFSRTKDFPDSTPEETVGDLVHLVMVYEEDGTTRLYRNGQPYGGSFNMGRATFPAGKSSIIFGLRHLPAGGNRYLAVAIDQARLYDRALTTDEVAKSAAGHAGFVSDGELRNAMSDNQQERLAALEEEISTAEKELKSVPANQNIDRVLQEAQNRYDNHLKTLLRSNSFRRTALEDPRFGGIVTNAAVMSMTSGPDRTHPVARGVWVVEVIFNDPPAPPPNDVPPLNEDAGDDDLTIREKFAVHRENPSCAGCHNQLDPLGFALENYDITGRWRNRYRNGRDVDPSGRLMRQHDFGDVIEFKRALLDEDRQFARALVEHLLRFALARELDPADAVTVHSIMEASEPEGFRLRSLIQQIVLSEGFRF